MGSREHSLGDQPLKKGVAHRALKHLASGGQGRGLPLSPLNSLPSQTDPLLVWCGGRGREENRGFRWVLEEKDGRALA